MTPKQRLKQLADQVKAAGLAGKSMQDKLAEVVEKNDLTGHDIQRIAEMANRDVQLELYKTAADKRFKFKLADAGPLKQAARKQAEAITPASGMHKVAAAIDQAGGDPFAVPYRAPKNFSLYDHPMDEKIAASIESAESRKTLQELDKVRLEYEALRKQGEAELVKVADKVNSTNEKLVQHALDMLMSGVTFSSLYQAMQAAAGGGKCTEEDREKVDELAIKILEGLKKRRVPNHRLGFSHRGNVSALDKLTPQEILALAKHSLGQITPQDLQMCQTKKADYNEGYVSGSGNSLAWNMLNEANQYMKNRPAQVEHPCPQVYLDNTDNLEDGQPRVINTDNQFVIAVKDLMGDQSRMVRMHSANEYIGLKLQQIEQAMRDLGAANKTAEESKAAAKADGEAANDKKKGLKKGVEKEKGVLDRVAEKPVETIDALANAVNAGANVAGIVKDLHLSNKSHKNNIELSNLQHQQSMALARAHRGELAGQSAGQLAGQPADLSLVPPSAPSTKLISLDHALMGKSPSFYQAKAADTKVAIAPLVAAAGGLARAALPHVAKAVAGSVASKLTTPEQPAAPATPAAPKQDGAKYSAAASAVTKAAPIVAKGGGGMKGIANQLVGAAGNYAKDMFKNDPVGTSMKAINLAGRLINRGGGQGAPQGARRGAPPPAHIGPMNAPQGGTTSDGSFHA